MLLLILLLALLLASLRSSSTGGISVCVQINMPDPFPPSRHWKKSNQVGKSSYRLVFQGHFPCHLYQYCRNFSNCYKLYFNFRSFPLCTFIHMYVLAAANLHQQVLRMQNEQRMCGRGRGQKGHTDRAGQQRHWSQKFSDSARSSACHFIRAEAQSHEALKLTNILAVSWHPAPKQKCVVIKPNLIAFASSPSTQHPAPCSQLFGWETLPL